MCNSLCSNHEVFSVVESCLLQGGQVVGEVLSGQRNCKKRKINSLKEK